MRTALYVRVAVATPTGQPLIERKPPIEQQLDRLREHLIARGEMPTEENIFRDEGRSGITLDRPAREPPAPHLPSAVAPRGQCADRAAAILPVEDEIKRLVLS